MRLDGKVALITGAARGQGAAAARRFAAEGARVMITDVLDDQGKELAAELGAEYCHLDVSSEDGWADAVEFTVATFGDITVLVNNAGILHFSALADTTLADYQRVIGINQVGTFLGMRAVVSSMKQAGGGSIVNVSSVEGLGGMPYLVAYTASKFAIRGMTKVAAMELGQHGIRVNSVHPGAIDTPMVSQALGRPIDVSPIGKKLALRRIGQPEDVANVVLFLASDDSAYCTGGEFVVDGGATATHALNG
ncbi:3alpha(or 20beta)-hydroxysteroid dehydrogenase [Lentzea albidocapillata subsp. violacea]|uniref:3alpha(Or 20beta)-hydroxysteroid dehydrogenase n=1 Tax=Lentzea albidocapillata subsp. violacea TaxID=128104 RepID=A0A1G8R676_9PSEU|nr:glucose 1-dehydrogenase [Lentzea albidocapillata]SDJ12459.1 3alpha(or 20beta)-hydroxysteroid dehydrogenase [Lentzea albidocapillata subsp. violacea]